MDLQKLQTSLAEWLNYNFPDTTSDKQLKGVMEELGELCHADLKHDQGIRGYDDPEIAEEKILDAVGDLVIYLINYCNKKDISFKDSITLACKEVMGRDWIQNPKTGKKEDVEIMICGLCGSSTKGRQWHNNKPGSSICRYCYTSLKNTCRDTEHLHENFGDEGYHFNIKES